MQRLRDLDKTELSALVKELGAPAYRAGQIFKWAQKAGVSSYDEMTDLPKALRGALAERCALSAPEMLRRQIAQDGTRYLFLMNFSSEPATVAIGPGCTDLLTGKPAPETLQLKGMQGATLCK